MSKVLESATSIQVSTTYRGKPTLIAYLSQGNNNRYWEAMRRECRFSASTPPAGSVDFTFDIHASPDTYWVLMTVPGSKSEPMISYNYASASGKLGNGKEWGEVPTEIKTWLADYKRKISDASRAGIP